MPSDLLSGPSASLSLAYSRPGCFMVHVLNFTLPLYALSETLILGFVVVHSKLKMRQITLDLI